MNWKCFFLFLLNAFLFSPGSNAQELKVYLPKNTQGASEMIISRVEKLEEVFVDTIELKGNVAYYPCSNLQPNTIYDLHFFGNRPQQRKAMVFLPSGLQEDIIISVDFKKEFPRNLSCLNNAYNQSLFNILQEWYNAENDLRLYAQAVDYSTDSVFAEFAFQRAGKRQSKFQSFKKQALYQLEENLLSANSQDTLSDVFRDLIILLNPSPLATYSNKIYPKFFWTKAEVENEVLVNSNIGRDRIDLYMKGYSKYGETVEVKNARFIDAVAAINALFEEDDYTQKSINLYLYEKLVAMKFGEAADFIQTNYLTRSECERVKNKLADKGINKKIDVKELINLNSNDESIERDFQYLIVWADWCNHCQELLPIFREKWAIQQHKPSVMSYAISESEAANLVIPAKYPSDGDWMQLVGDKGWDSYLLKALNITAVPTLFRLKNGKVHEVIDNPLDIFND